MITYKSDLLNQLASCNRGLLSSSTEQTAILAAIAQLEDYNPTPKPVESSLLEGDWRLLYTTSRGILGIDQIPIFKLGDVYQSIRLDTQSVYNIAEVVGVPLLEGIISVAARFTPVSERRVNVNFERFVIGSQQFLGYRTPAQYIDRLRSQTRLWAIDYTIPPRQNLGWLDITYLDPELRIGRGNEGSVFVLAKV